jgi:GTP cyclohydrolase I
LQRTPERVARALEFLIKRLSVRIGNIVSEALYSVKYDEMMIVKDIEFFSFCEHHLLPFYAKMHVAYLPEDRVIGKLPRIVDAFARRLQIQERLTRQVAQSAMLGAFTCKETRDEFLSLVHHRVNGA